MLSNNSGKINLMIIIIIVVLQILLGAGLYFFVFNKPDGSIKPIKAETKKDSTESVDEESKDSEEKDEKNKGDKKSKSEAKDYINEYTLFSLEDIVVNPKDSPDKFLVITMALEFKLKDENLPTELKNKTLLLKDRINFYFAQKTYDELEQLQNREKYKKELLKMVNNLLTEGKITNVIFAQFVLQ